MTVAELIVELQAQPQDAKVFSCSLLHEPETWRYSESRLQHRFGIEDVTAVTVPGYSDIPVVVIG